MFFEGIHPALVHLLGCNLLLEECNLLLNGCKQLLKVICAVGYPGISKAPLIGGGRFSLGVFNGKLLVQSCLLE
jgi:hypothetical protein